MMICSRLAWFKRLNCNPTAHHPLHRALWVLGWALTMSACSRPVPADPPIRAVRTQVVQTQAMGGAAEYAGEIRARTESRLGFRVGGKVAQRLVNLGDRVKAGQALALLDPGDLQLAQSAAQAALRSAQAQLEQAQADHQRAASLRDQGFISAAEFDRRAAALTAARSAQEQAQAQAAVQQNQASYTRLVADAPGVITSVDAEPGTVVAAGQAVLRLAHEGLRDVVFAVPEDKVDFFRGLAVPGASPLRVRLWGSGLEFSARVREVAAAADAVSRTFLIRATLGEQAEAVVRLGQTATVRVELPKVEAALRLPLSAIGALQGRSVVWVVEPASMTVSPQTVMVAGASGNEVVVASGLKPGQRVVTAGVHVLSPGQKVRLYQEPGRSSLSSEPRPLVPVQAASMPSS
jgi:multidrug efflux system membrane fusion protein